MIAYVDHLLTWQWQGYARNHTLRSNLILHVASVPFFVAGALAFVHSLVRQEWVGVVAALVVAVVAFAAQGIGHKLEPERPEPFTGVGDFFARVIAEQFITFPRFVLSGGWFNQFARACRKD